MRRLVSLALLAASLAPTQAAACAVCFNRGEGPDVSRAFFWGGAILLICTFGLLASFVGAVVMSSRRESAARAARVAQSELSTLP